MADHETNTADVINHAIDKASDGLQQIAHSLSNAAPQAWALAVHGVYAQAVASMIVGVLCLIICVITGYFGVRCVRQIFGDGDDCEYWIFPAVLCGMLCFGFGTRCCANLLDASNWTALIAPDAYLAKTILSAALK